MRKFINIWAWVGLCLFILFLLLLTFIAHTHYLDCKALYAKGIRADPCYSSLSATYIMFFVRFYFITIPLALVSVIPWVIKLFIKVGTNKNSTI
jgi:hypothetical protein